MTVLERLECGFEKLQVGHFGLQALAVLLMGPPKRLEGLEANHWLPELREHWDRRNPEVGRIAIVEQKEEAAEQTALPD